MPYNGTGTFTPQYNWTNDAANGINIRADRHDGQDGDIATGLSTCITKDGQTTPTANLPMGGFRHTGVGNSSARTMYGATGQIQDGSFLWGGTASGSSNAFTLTLTPAITAYTAGQTFRFIANHAINGATTININAVGAKTIKKNISVDLETGDIQNGQLVEIIYDGTNFQLFGDVNNRPINMGDTTLTRAKLLDYSITNVSANSGTAYTVDLTTGNSFVITLTGDVTFTFSNPPASGSFGIFTLKLVQDGTGGRSVTWPASVDWGGGTAPTISSAIGKVDQLTFVTTDGGTTWLGFVSGQDMR